MAKMAIWSDQSDPRDAYSSLLFARISTGCLMDIVTSGVFSVHVHFFFLYGPHTAGVVMVVKVYLCAVLGKAAVILSESQLFAGDSII